MMFSVTAGAGASGVRASLLGRSALGLALTVLAGLPVAALAQTEAAAPPASAPPASAPAAAPADDEAPPAPPPAASGNAGGATGPEGDAIIVTATKREQTLQNVPVAVTVTSGKTLEQAQIRDIADLATVVPSLKVDQHESSAETNFLIRGFGNGANNVGIEPSVGVFIDGVYRSRSAAELSDFTDVTRIEVLRGPQSTLFGKNASAGVISITTQEPQFHWHATFEGTYENYDGAVLKGMITGPLTDTLAFSLSGGYDNRRGYDHNLTTGSYLNNRNRWFIRGQALWTPSPQLKVRLIADYDRIDELCCGVVNVQPSSPAYGSTQVIEALGGQVNSAANPYGDTVYANYDPTNHIRNYGFSGQIDYNMGPFKLTSITALRKNTTDTNEDADFTSADLLGTYAQQVGDRNFTQELRISSDLPGPLNFLIGGFFQDEHIHQANQITYGSQFADYANDLIEGLSGCGTAAGAATCTNLSTVEGKLGTVLAGNPAYFQNTPGNPNAFFGAGQGQFETFTLHDQSISIFAQADYKPFDRLTLTGGINYTHDSKHFTEATTSTDTFSNLPLANIAAGLYPTDPLDAVGLLELLPLQLLPPVLGLPNSVEPGHTSDGNVSWTARASYEASKQVKLYLNFGTGFKASSINLSRDSRPALADAPALEALGYPAPTQVVGPYTITSAAYGSRVAGPEHSTLFEGGVKADWGKATFNLALFDEIIRGFQSELFTGTGFYLANAGKESEWGIEAEGALHVTRELTLSGAVDWYNPNYDSFVISSVGDLTGTKPAGIPPVTINLVALEDHPFANGDHLILRGDWHYESKTQMVEGLPAEITRNPITQAVEPGGYANAVAEAEKFTRQVSEFDASLTYAFHGGLELMGWVRNLTNDRYLITVFDSPAQTDSISAYTNEPRTYGMTARVKW